MFVNLIGGDVKLKIKGKWRKLQMAVFTSAYGNYRIAFLFSKQKIECFQDGFKGMENCCIIHVKSKY
jgi:hypothetical protein